ncbi:hypothetical protein FRC02_003702, partial [Tulasnella sp. 418]
TSYYTRATEASTADESLLQVQDSTLVIYIASPHSEKCYSSDGSNDDNTRRHHRTHQYGNTGSSRYTWAAADIPVPQSIENPETEATCIPAWSPSQSYVLIYNVLVKQVADNGSQSLFETIGD